MSQHIEFTDPVTTVDSDWLRTAFIVDVDSITESARGNIFASFADRYFLDTSIGGASTLNPPYQFTRYADIPRKGRNFNAREMSPQNRDYEIGLGRYYADAIESNLDILILEFGVPEFQSMFSFFTRAVDYNKSIVATEGRSTFFYDVGKGLGYLGILVSLNLASVLIYAGIGAFKALVGNGDTRYYHMKPAMPQYWKMVNSIATYLAVERGIIAPTFMEGEKTRLGLPIEVDQDIMNTLHEAMPSIFRDGNYIDVFAIAQRPQVQINRQLIEEMKVFKEFRFSKYQISDATNQLTGKLDQDVNFESYMKELQKLSMYDGDDEDNRSIGEVESTSGKPEDYQKPDEKWTYLKLPIEKAVDFMGELAEYTNATNHHGGKTVMLAVEHVGSMTDTFTNSTKDIPTQEKLNGLGGAARDIRFSLSGGNVLGSAIQDITNAAKDVAMGTLDSMTFGLSNVIGALMGGGFISMPKMWADSSVSLATHTYKITVAPPYGNAITKTVDMDFVLAVILAGMLPQSVGQSSYTSPLLCKAFLRGRQRIDFGMITNCSITRGINNVPYDKDGRTLGLEISFTITDFSEMMTAPTPDGIFGAFGIGLDENNPLNKYLNTIAGRDYHSTAYISKKGFLRATKAYMGLQAVQSPAYLGMKAGDSVFGRMIETVVPDITNTHLRDTK